MKKVLLGLLVGLVICLCTFAILYKTKVISFESNKEIKKECNSDERFTNEICRKESEIDGAIYTTILYKDSFTNRYYSLTYLPGNKSDYFFDDSINSDDKFYELMDKQEELDKYIKDNCNEFMPSVKRELIKSENNYSYYLYELYKDDSTLTNFWKYIVSEVEGINVPFIITKVTQSSSVDRAVPIEKKDNYTNDDKVLRVRIKDNKVYELDGWGESIVEYEYALDKSNYTKTKTNNLYYCIANCK